ncbi:hypothetical protein LEP1GSC087_0662 [Leptospira interrogans serovar Bataviae str. L1111]|nr:hypothetical protein LEP1GSC087_0662 [Leptospira interrogans serovar Bataviae str. L1111]
MLKNQFSIGFRCIETVDRNSFVNLHYVFLNSIRNKKLQ